MSRFWRDNAAAVTSLPLLFALLVPVLTASPTQPDTHSTTATSTVVGTNFATTCYGVADEEWRVSDGTKCQCDSDCHECAWDSNLAEARQCSICMDKMALLDGSCVAQSACPGSAQLNGKSSFGIACIDETPLPAGRGTELAAATTAPLITSITPSTLETQSTEAADATQPGGDSTSRETSSECYALSSAFSTQP